MVLFFCAFLLGVINGWLVFWVAVVPGVAYAVWRSQGVHFACPRCGGRVVSTESSEGLGLLGATASIPKDGFSGREQASRFIRALPLVGGFVVATLFIASILFPSIRKAEWLEWVLYPAVLAILGHPLWFVIDKVIGATSGAKE